MKALRTRIYNLLRASERIFKTDMVYLTKGGFWLGGSQILSGLVSLGLAIAFAHLVTKDVYGNYKYILSLAGIIGSLSLSGVGTSIIRATARGYEGTFKKGVWMNLKWDSTMFLAAAAVSAYYAMNHNYILATSLVVIGITYPILDSTSNYGKYLNGKKEFSLTFKTSLLQNIIPSLCVFLVLLFSKNILAISSALFISSTVVSAALYYWTINRFKPNNTVDEVSLQYGKHLSVMGFMSPVSNQIDSVLLYHYLGPAALAVYAFAVAIPDRIMGLFKNLHLLSLPNFSNKNMHEIKVGLAKKIFISGLFSIGIFIIYLLMAPLFFHLLFPQYNDSILFSQIFSFNIVLSTLGILPAAYFDSQAEVRNKYIVVTTTNMLKIILMMVLVVPFGIMGIISGEMIARVIALIIMFILIFGTKKGAAFETMPL